MVIEPFEEANHYDYALLKAEIATLEDKYKNVLVYTYFYGMNADETADAMGVSRRTVYNYINEARAILKEKLGEELNV